MAEPAPEPDLSHRAAPPFAHASGPRDARIAIVGEAFGQSEALAGQPFVGASGQELTRMLVEAGIDRSTCFITNVLAFQPMGNNLDTLCQTKAECGAGYPYPALKPARYLRPEFFPELDRLRGELAAVLPNVVVALGNTALWALLGQTNIGSVRGVVTMSPWGHKVLPSWHPASVLRNWAQRPIVVADLLKAAKESSSPTITRPSRTVTYNPTLREIADWMAKGHASLAVDIETMKGTITCIGFARDPADALVVPFWSPDGGNYWTSPRDEQTAWEMVRALLQGPAVKIFQNGLYDLQFLFRMGFRPRNCTADTMLLHHSLYPELQKGLGFLGSVYSSEAAWKLMRKRRGAEPNLKADDE